MPSGTGWTDSPLGMLSLFCISVLNTCLVNYADLHRWLSVCLHVHRCSCAIHTATAVPQMCFSFTCII